MIDGFPTDNQFWLIKWIDGFSHAAGMAMSPSVRICLQQLPQMTTERLRKLSRFEVKPFLGPVTSEVRIVRILAGSLPLLRIGDIYRKGQPVGRLPRHQQPVALPADCDIAPKSVGTAIAAPAGWKSSRSHLVLNKFEYAYPWPDFAPSQALVIERPSETVVIPSSVIFSCIYALDTPFANTLLAGSWDMERKRLICFDKLESGLETAVCVETGDWKIVVRPGIHAPHVPFLAWMNFSLEGQAFANRIWSSIFSTSRNGKGMGFIDARIPMGDAGTKLICQGFEISTIPGHGKFLVTDIVSCTFPPAPPIAYEYPFSSRPGDVAIKVEEDFIYCPTRTAEGTSDIVIADDLDALRSAVSYLFPARAITFENPPDLYKQKKLSSKNYEGSTNTVMPDDPMSGITSTGIDGVGSSSAIEGRAQQQRNLEHRYDQVYSALEGLQASQTIVGLHTIPPEDPRRRPLNGRRECWRFQPYPTFVEDPEGKAFRFRRYTVINDQELGRRSHLPRTALALAFRFRLRNFIWIEIGGARHEHFKAALLWDCEGNEIDVISEALDIIAVNQGVSFGEMLKSRLAIRYAAGAATVIHHVVDGQLNGKAISAAIARTLEERKCVA